MGINGEVTYALEDSVLARGCLFKPQISEIEREDDYSRWQNAVSHAIRWVDKD